MVTPNSLTFLRLLIALICPPLLIWARSFTSDVAVAVLFTGACITDWWDGYLARKKSLITPIGKIIDPIADKLLILGLMITFMYLRLYRIEWILPIIFREAAVTATRFIQLKRKNVIPAEWAGKIKLGFQIGSIYASLIYLSVHDGELFSGTPWALTFFQWFHYLGIILANFFTISSGIRFFQRLE